MRNRAVRSQINSSILNENVQCPVKTAALREREKRTLLNASEFFSIWNFPNQILCDRFILYIWENSNQTKMFFAEFRNYYYSILEMNYMNGNIVNFHFKTMNAIDKTNLGKFFDIVHKLRFVQILRVHRKYGKYAIGRISDIFDWVWSIVIRSQMP